MPLDELTGHALGGLLRVLARVAVELLFELPVRGLGYAMLRLAGRRVREDDAACVVAGLAFWAVVALLAWLAWRTVLAG